MLFRSIMKAGILSEDASILSLYFAPTDQGPVFLVEEETGFSRSIPFDQALYEKVAQSIADLPEQETEINQNWVRSMQGEETKLCH